MVPNKKGGLALMILEHAKKKTKPEYGNDDAEGEADADAGLKSAMSDLIAAVHAKDEDAAVEAFKAAMTCHAEE